jgi:hypothetical protein
MIGKLSIVFLARLCRDYRVVNLLCCVAAFSLNQSDDSVLVRCPNDGIAFSVTDMSASLNRFGALSIRASIWGLPSSIMATGIAFALLFLATQGAP